MCAVGRMHGRTVQSLRGQSADDDVDGADGDVVDVEAVDVDASEDALLEELLDEPDDEPDLESVL